MEKSKQTYWKNIIKIICGENIIAVDKGLEALYQLHIIPNHVVGDFDSAFPEILEFYKNQSQIIFHKFNAEKDNTDTDIAVKLAIE